MDDLLPNLKSSYNNNNNNSQPTQSTQLTQTIQSDKISTDNVKYDKALIRSLPQTVYYGLEYPANVQNPDKAIESVGGLSKITKVIKSREKEYLQLRFRPNNPTCKPSFGTKSPTCNVLLRVRPIKPQQQQSQSQSQSQSQQQQQQQHNLNDNSIIDNYGSPKPLLMPMSPSIISPMSPLSPKSNSRYQNPHNNESNISQQPTSTQSISSSQTTTSKKQQYDATVIAIVPTTITFDGLCDFQYLIKENKDQVKKDQYYAENIEEDDITRDEPLNLIPPLFSRVDFPKNYLFKNNPNAHFDQDTKQFIISKQNLRKTASHIHFTDEIPNKSIKIPHQLEINDLMKRTFDITKELFEKRPIWLLVALADNVVKNGGQPIHLKRLLPSIAFNYVDGPWRKCWVKLGYDPKINKDTWKYQVIDFRITDPDSHFATNRQKLIVNNNNNNNNNNININNINNNNSNIIKSPQKTITTTQTTPNQTTIITTTTTTNVGDKEDDHAKIDNNINSDNNDELMKDSENDTSIDKTQEIAMEIDKPLKDNENNNDNQSQQSKEKEELNKNNTTTNNNNNNTVPSESIPIFNNESSSQRINPYRKKGYVINTFDFNTSKNDQQQFLPPSFEGYDYTFKTLPTQKINTFYQICDIEDQKIKSYFDQQEQQDTCQKKHGWLSESSFKEGLERMKNRYGISDNRLKYRSRSSNKNDQLSSATLSTTPTTASTRRSNKKNTNNNNNNNNNDTDDDNNTITTTEDTNINNDQLPLKGENLEQINKDYQYLEQKKDLDLSFNNDGIPIVGGFDFDDDNENETFQILDEDSQFSPGFSIKNFGSSNIDFEELGNIMDDDSSDESESEELYDDGEEEEEEDDDEEDEEDEDDD